VIEYRRKAVHEGMVCAIGPVDGAVGDVPEAVPGEWFGLFPGLEARLLARESNHAVFRLTLAAKVGEGWAVGDAVQVTVKWSRPGSRFFSEHRRG